jgi:signal transduction histidine kinase
MQHERPVVLVIEDDAAMAEFLGDILEPVGYAVEIAPSAPAGYVRIEAGGIALVILDLLLPELDGLELCRRVRARLDAVYLPIIMLTALADQRHAGFAAGADDYVLKPFNVNDLLARVQVWVQTRQRLEAAHAGLRDAHADLARRVDERTAELLRANQAMQREIAERQQAEQALRESEEQLRQSQKMDAVGQLAGGVAHDFNNLLTVINGFSELLEARLAPADPLSPYIAEIKTAADRATALTRQLLAFSRLQVLQPKVLDLNGVVAGMSGMLRRLISEDIALITHLDPTVGRVEVDPGQLEQVILNLGVNARDAMPRGGTLTITTANALRSHPPGGRALGAYVALTVRDTGCGIDAATQARIFEPFFTTKEQGKGTGLGLSTVYGIVKQSGGDVAVRSTPGRGTEFTIYLPRVEHAATAPAPSRGPMALPRGTETVLLVEDEAQVRAVVREVLETNGYTALEAAHGDDALEVARHYVGPIHLLVTDVVMPGMSGRELSQRLAIICPGVQTLYMSAHTDHAIVHQGVLEADLAFLQKPFSLEALVLKVREVLDAASPSSPAGAAR